MALRATVALLVAAFLVAGCTSSLSSSAETGEAGSQEADASPDPRQAEDPSPPPEDPQQADPPAGSSAGTPQQHGEPTRTEGQVEVRQEGTQYVATRLVTIENDFGGAQRATLALSTTNGAISVQPSSGGGYLLDALLQGRGATEQDARQALELIELESSDDLQGDRLDLTFTIVTESPAPLPLPIPIQNGVNTGASLTLYVPSEPAHDLEAGTTNGAISASGLHGPRFDASTTNGAITLVGAFDEALAKTDNGAISLGGGTLNDVTAQTNNGAITLQLDPSRSSTVTLTTGNGRIDVGVPGDDQLAFDIQADNTNGEITIDVEGSDIDTHEGHGEYRSPDWARADVQLALDLQTNNGAIDVSDDE